MTTLEIIRLVGKEFADVSDGDIQSYIELSAPLVSKKKFGKFYEQALAYMVCHRLKMVGYGESGLNEIENISKSAGALGIGSISDGGSSVSFTGRSSSGGASGSAADAELLLTDYGLQFIALRRLFVVSITI